MAIQTAIQATVVHARLAASSAERWLNCPGSVKLAESSPRTTSFAAAEGTYAHLIAAQCLASDRPPAIFLGAKANIDDYKVECDRQMVEGVAFYLAIIDSLRLNEFWAEMSLTNALREWDADLGGTVDYVTYDPKIKLLRVVDFKYGAGVFVAADDNKQLMQYALGAMLTVGVPVETVEMVIVQPRYEGVDPVRKQIFPAWRLMEFAADLADAAQRTRLPDSPLVAGPWCASTFCPNARICPELERHQHALIKAEFTEIAPYDPQALATALAAIPLVKERIKAIESFAYAQATAGKEIPGYKLVDKRPRRQWTDEKAVIVWAKKHAIEPFEDPTLKSPAQLEKGLKKEEKAELAVFTASVSSGTTLVPTADSRPAVTNMITVNDFAAIGGPANSEPQSPAFNVI